MRPCARCGEEKRIVARGLCQNCYKRLRNQGRLDSYPAIGQRGRPPQARMQPRRPVDWRAVAEQRKAEIDRLRERIAQLEGEQ